MRRERRTQRKTFPALLPDQLAALTEYYGCARATRSASPAIDSQALMLKPRDALPLWPQAVGRARQRAAAQGAHAERERRSGRAVPSSPSSRSAAPLTRDSVQPSFDPPPAGRRIDQPDAPTSRRHGLDACATSQRASRRSWRCTASSRTAACRWRTWCTRTGWRRCRCSSSRCRPVAGPGGTLAPGRGQHLHPPLPDQLVTVLGEAPAADGDADRPIPSPSRAVSGAALTRPAARPGPRRRRIRSPKEPQGTAMLRSLVLAALFAGPAVRCGHRCRDLPDFTDLAEKQGPAVVNVSTTSTVHAASQALPPGSEDDPFNDFFRRFGPPQPPRDYETRSLGSGFIISSQDGYHPHQCACGRGGRRHHGAAHRQARVQGQGDRQRPPHRRRACSRSRPPDCPA